MHFFQHPITNIYQGLPNVILRLEPAGKTNHGMSMTASPYVVWPHKYVFEQSSLHYPFWCSNEAAAHDPDSSKCFFSGSQRVQACLRQVPACPCVCSAGYKGAPELL